MEKRRISAPFSLLFLNYFWSQISLRFVWSLNRLGRISVRLIWCLNWLGRLSVGLVWCLYWLGWFNLRLLLDLDRLNRFEYHAFYNPTFTAISMEEVYFHRGFLFFRIKIFQVNSSDVGLVNFSERLQFWSHLTAHIFLNIDSKIIILIRCLHFDSHVYSVDHSMFLHQAMKQI
jgi:hypothetical protein